MDEKKLMLIAANYFDNLSKTNLKTTKKTLIIILGLQNSVSFNHVNHSLCLFYKYSILNQKFTLIIIVYQVM